MKKKTFRAWYSAIKRMISHDELMNMNLAHVFESPEFIKMESTGLPSAQEKEVFEGDIVKYFDELDGELELFGVVEWENAWWSVNLHPQFLRENDIMDMDISYEVVGNIFENGHLVPWYKKYEQDHKRN